MIGLGVVVLIVVVGVFIVYFATATSEQKKLQDELNNIRQHSQNGDDDDSDGIPTSTGGSTDKYSWDQTEDALDVAIPLDEFLPTPTVREIDVSIKAGHLKVTIRRTVYIEGNFYDKVRVDDCYWTLERESLEKATLQLSLIKQRSSESDLWPHVLIGDPMINLPRRSMPSVETVDPSNPSSVRNAVKSVTH